MDADEPEILALGEVLVEDGVDVRVGEEVLGPAALFRVRISFAGKVMEMAHHTVET